MNAASRLTFTVAESAQALGVCEVTVRRLIRDGVLTSVRVRSRILVTAESLHALVGVHHGS